MRRRTLFQHVFVGTFVALAVSLLIVSGFFLVSVVGILTQSDAEELSTSALQMATVLKDRDWQPGPLPEQPGSSLGPQTSLVGLADLQAGAGGQLTADRVRAVLSGQTATQYQIRYFGIGNATVAAPLWRGGKVAGAVLAVMQVPEAARARSSIARTFGLAVLMSVPLAAILGYAVYRSVARPLSRMGQLSRRIAAGDFSQRMDLCPPKEVAELGAALNDMAARLDRLERSRRDLMANVSHEVKGPLSRMAGYIAAVEDGIGGEQARAGYLAIVRQETMRLSRLLDDLLDFARLESGRLTLHRLPCDLMPLLERIAVSFRPQAEAAGITLRGPLAGGEPGTQIPPVECDPERVVQIAGNLLSNALAVTPRGGEVCLIASARGTMTEVAVTDTGPGVPVAERQAIWERFFKLDKVRTPGQSKGHGLGLAIVRQLVHLHGGQVGVADDPSGGARFWFTLPLAQQSPEN